MDNNSKNIALVSYITLIGWIIALIMRNSSNDKSSLVVFHLRQSLGLAISFYVIIALLGMLHLTGLSQIVVLANIVYAIIGILNASGEKETLLPYIGKFFDEKLTFIK